MIKTLIFSLTCGGILGGAYAYFFWRGHTKGSALVSIHSFIARYLLIFVTLGLLYKSFQINIGACVAALLLVFWGSVLLKAGLFS